jgi:hypothetical protein
MASLLVASMKASSGVGKAFQVVRVSTAPKFPERGILYSMQTMDKTMMEQVKKLEDFFVGKPTASRVEKGVLFSAPCLKMCRDGEYYDGQMAQPTASVSKGDVFMVQP